MECHKKGLILKFYYLVGLNLLMTGNVAGQGFSHVADIFRILNHVEIPAIENFFPLVPPPFASFLGNDNQAASGEVDDIRLFVVDGNNPTLKQEVSKRNYLSRMTGALRDRTSGQVQGVVRDGLRHGQQSIRDGKLRAEKQVTDDIKDGETDIENEVELVEEATTTSKRRNKLKIIVHGWGESASKSWYAQMTAAYMLKEMEKKQTLPKSDITEDLKVLQVDWSVQAAAEYSIAARNTRRVGHYVGQFIADLYKDLDYALDDIHIIGHSLGGHVAGFIGKEVLRITGQSIGRITALDPAGPLFEGSLISKEDRLTDTDAKLVDIVHTDGGFFGCKTPLGTIDFYPNGGVRIQPGCDQVGATRFTMDDILEFAFCSHTRSYKYFIESIDSNDVTEATKCDSWANFEAGLCSDEVRIRFGEDLPLNAERGTYFFKTNSEPPFTISA